MIASPSVRYHRAALSTLFAAALLAAAAACGGAKSGRSDYVQDGDSGAASPASTPTVNNPQAPDSTAGVSQRTGAPGSAGDTLDAKGKATANTNPVTSGKKP